MPGDRGTEEDLKMKYYENKNFYLTFRLSDKRYYGFWARHHKSCEKRNDEDKYDNAFGFGILYLYYAP